MEKVKRRPFQGVWNIIRFNWHFYVVALFIICVLLFSTLLCPQYTSVLILVAVFVFLPLLLSLIVSYYVYDWTDLYELDWLNKIDIRKHANMVNINAGFDETSASLVEKFEPSSFKALDFYDAKIHTEVSIKRARRAGLIYPNTVSISTSHVPLDATSADYIFLIFALHEIRDREERIIFLISLKSKLLNGGRIIVVEHLRDVPNFAAYTVGFFHFYAKRNWENDFRLAQIKLAYSGKLNPFVHIFVLE